MLPYKERLRVLLILYYFSESHVDLGESSLVRKFTSEVKIQKIDFLLRYPSYLCYELLKDYERGLLGAVEVKTIVSSIFGDNEPQLRTDEMKRFFFGAYEELDDVIAFLKSVGFIEFRSQKNASFRDVQKTYFITKWGEEKITKGLAAVPTAKWYIDRCKLIQKYFGDSTGSNLKNRQYEIEEYKETPLGNYIEDIENKVVKLFYQHFQETL